MPDDQTPTEKMDNILDILMWGIENKVATLTETDTEFKVEINLVGPEGGMITITGPIRITTQTTL